MFNRIKQIPKYVNFIYRGLNKSQPVQLTLTEFKLLSILTSQPGRVFTREQLLSRINDQGTYIIDRNIDVHIRAIRKKIQNYPDFIKTVRGIGYKCKEISNSLHS